MKPIYLIFFCSIFLISCKEETKEIDSPKDDGLTTISNSQFQSMNMEIGAPIERDFRKY